MNNELYLSVIYQGIRDAVSNDEKKVHKAYDWFSSKDFEKICELAGINPDPLRHAFLSIRNEKNPKDTADNMISSIRALAWQKESILSKEVVKNDGVDPSLKLDS